MRRILGILVLLPLVSLAACGSEDPGSAGSGDPSTPTTPAAAGRVVGILSGTAAGGRTGEAVPVDSPDAIAAFVAQFRTPQFAAEVRASVDAADPGPGETVYAAVVAIGCDVPPSASVSRDGNAVTITPGKVLAPLKECFAPVTSVVVAVV